MTQTVPYVPPNSGPSLWHFFGSYPASIRAAWGLNVGPAASLPVHSYHDILTAIPFLFASIIINTDIKGK